jgi:zinc protease
VNLSRGLARRVLANGLEVVLLERPDSPGVSVALWYDVGSREETPAELGAAHFLEHMMFKGSARFGPGVLDQRTQALGGSNNAFTSHDATVYWFRAPPEGWTEILEMEADRMAALSLDPVEVESEREVIVEEIAMYASDPWDALEQEVLATLWGPHPYAQPILGTEASLAALGATELGAFRRRWYQPNRARLVVAGPLSMDQVVQQAQSSFGAIAGVGVGPRVEAPAVGPAAPRRVERRMGELARLMVALAAPPTTSRDHAHLRVLAAVLGSGRNSRLHARLVEHDQLCSFVSVHQGDGALGSVFSLTAELHEGADPARVEAVVDEEIQRLSETPPAGAELARARRQIESDFVFGHESVHEQGLGVGGALALGDEPGQPEQSLAWSLAARPDELAFAARTWLGASGRVVGWSLPRGER